MKLKACKNCEKEFKTAYGKQKYCSNKCARHYIDSGKAQKDLTKRIEKVAREIKAVE